MKRRIILAGLIALILLTVLFIIGETSSDDIVKYIPSSSTQLAWPSPQNLHAKLVINNIINIQAS